MVLVVAVIASLIPELRLAMSLGKTVNFVPGRTSTNVFNVVVCPEQRGNLTVIVKNSCTSVGEDIART